jgi:hypothetical protein
MPARPDRRHRPRTGPTVCTQRHHPKKQTKGLKKKKSKIPKRYTRIYYSWQDYLNDTVAAVANGVESWREHRDRGFYDRRDDFYQVDTEPFASHLDNLFSYYDSRNTAVIIDIVDVIDIDISEAYREVNAQRTFQVLSNISCTSDEKQRITFREGRMSSQDFADVLRCFPQIIELVLGPGCEIKGRLAAVNDALSESTVVKNLRLIKMEDSQNLFVDASQEEVAAFAASLSAIPQLKVFYSARPDANNTLESHLVANVSSLNYC